MMEQSTQTTNNNERPKKKMGRPKGTGIFTEENKERARQRAILCYSLIFQERGRKRI